MEARIPRRTLPAVGCAGLFVVASNGGRSRPAGRPLALHGPWRNESAVDVRRGASRLVRCRSCAVSKRRHTQKSFRAPDCPASPSGTTPNPMWDDAPPLVGTRCYGFGCNECLNPKSDISHERLAHPRRGWKPEFKEGRCPPLDGASCSPVGSLWRLIVMQGRRNG
jgi:hypothetical protein